MHKRCCCRRRVHRRAVHFFANLGDIAERPYFHAIREAADLDDESDNEIDYRVGSNQFRVYRQKFGDNYDEIVSKSFLILQPTIALVINTKLDQKTLKLLFSQVS